ncbi:hypothetical protein [Schleiferilactobacillus perolens]|uniref:hypothetical protein n=1 Tax=Schleiferilactobacillus perolens TaxID=100468 RepID=UPI0023567BF9|nr:hypothetical protein [Schleiferilactobacillus perolens]MCI1890508.1 hypothetical protein [Schleiferilactobacillus harbinensis]MCI1911663.1 hypothetical protein [Schleiferilactobacillus harbinensis]MCI2171801.1 hypothetical protein [Schleiferilactobacillus perolens]
MYLMHRIYNQTSAAEQKRLLEEENKLSTGYAAFVLAGEGENLIRHAQQMTKSDFAVYFQGLGQQMNLPWATGTRSHWLYYFLQLDAGDVVVVPEGHHFHLFQVTNGPQVEPAIAQAHDIGFVVTVKPLDMVVPTKRQLGPALTSILKFRGTDLKLTGQSVTDVQALLTPSQETQASEPSQKDIAQIQAALLKMPEKQYHQLIAHYLTQLGATEIIFPAISQLPTTDEPSAAADVIAVFRKLGAVVFVHAQQDDGVVDEAGIQKMVAYQYTTFEKFDTFVPIKWFVTTGHLPEEEDEAVGYVQENRVQVLQNTDLAERLVTAGISL